MNEEQRLTPFHHVLTYLNKGCINDEATEAYAEVVQAVRETGKKGKLLLQLDFAMFSKSDEDAMKVAATLKKTVPEHDRGETILFSTYDGDLLQNDPSQQNANLKTIEPSSSAIHQLEEASTTLKRVS
ncbi:hypothetical protein [Algicola sagamiensis]|uniref:hypothetical protein n=1 Tax=Algicola sagamiensis TaxID=163869 RepID=UPI0003A0EB09|nr:hypothetical protein [Algicola sagamiensis]